MQKQTLIAATLLLISFMGSPMSSESQTRAHFTKTSLSKMEVLSRAELFEGSIADAARKEGVDPYILWTIAYNETRFRPWLKSPRNAQGLMQFMPATAARFGLTDPYEPAASIQSAAQYVRYLSGLFDGRLDSILAAYNAGEGTVLAYLNGRTLVTNGKRINPTGMRTAGGIPPYKETINYVANGTTIYRWLQTQGKFERKGRDRKFDAANVTASPKVDGLDAIIVLYDPRSGRRYLVNDRSKLSPINASGPVVISPQIRSLPAQKARSTFAGITR